MLGLVGRIAVVLAGAALPGCMAGTANTGGNAGEEGTTTAEVAAKAVDVANVVGGAEGYGGTMMNGYAQHAPAQMGFHGADDLASPGRGMTVQLTNQAAEPCTFHVSYVASPLGLGENTQDVEVEPGETTTVDLPCGEIVGLGPLEEPGAIGCHLSGGQAVENTMAVPGFLQLDYECEGAYGCTLTPDVDDLDGDGDTEELILLSTGMEGHMTEGGPMGHLHGDGMGMMGSHMGM